jgi:4-amino-4-deoxy-L-arabinose transferase-like glycosyltransferase
MTFRRRPRLPEAALLAVLVLLYWAMAVSVSPRVGVTADELVHAVGGYSYWQFNDYRLHPENGTLPMRAAALPWLAMDLQFPPLTDHAWQHANAHVAGRAFFFETGNPFERLLLTGRAVIALFGAFTVWLTWRWARGLFGAGAGLIAAALAAFCPTLLAHGGLVTSDMAMTACVLAALTSAWRLLHRVTWGWLILTTVSCGAAFLSKMSGVLIVPLLAGMVLIRVVRGTPLVLALGRVHWLRRRAQIAGAGVGSLLAVAAGSLTLLWANYGFRYSTFHPALAAGATHHLPWAVLLDETPMPVPDDSAVDRLIQTQRPLQPTAMTRLLAALRDHRLLPEAYLWGFAHTYKFSRYRPAFFRGEYRATGWRMFFPTSFAAKTPLPAMLLIAAGVAGLVLRRARFRSWLYRATPLVLFFVVYWAMAIGMNLNIGHRHILPTYPIFYVVAGAAVAWVHRPARRLAMAALVLALGGHAVESFAARPFYLSYFQPLAGGMQRGYQMFVDSSYDWGQGLPALREWLERRSAAGERAPVFLTYFGVDAPRVRGIAAVRFADEWNDTGERVFPAAVRGGTFVISATHFQRVYLPVRGPWRQEHERLYQELLRRRAAATPGTSSPELVRDLMDLEMMQFGRLCHFLRDREPAEVIGGSLLVFQLTDAEVRAALFGPVTPAP